MPSYQWEDIEFHYYGSPDAPAGIGKGEQIYEKIVREAIASGNKFEDPAFPANSSSLGARFTQNIKWLRPHEYVKAMEFKSGPIFRGTCNEFIVRQGSVGDCWFLSVLAQVAMKPEAMDTVVPVDNGNNGFDGGAFHFRFFCRGKWVDVTVDDRLPCVMSGDGQVEETLFAKPTASGGFWPPLFEKAYAKLYGNYEAIAEGMAKVGMIDMTGGFINSLKAGNPKLLTHMKEGASQDALMTIGTKPTVPPGLQAPYDPKNPGMEQVSVEGMVAGHVYSLLDVQDVQEKNSGKKITLLKLRNPWGNYTEWNGDFSDKDPNNKWSTVEKDLRRISKDCLEDGEFWISYDAMVRYLQNVDICYWGSKYREGCIIPPGYGCVQVASAFLPENSGKCGSTESMRGKSGWLAHLKSTDPSAANRPDVEKDKDGRPCICELAISITYFNYLRAGVDNTIPNYGFYLLWSPGFHNELTDEFWCNVERFQGHTKYGRTRTNCLMEMWPEGTLLIVPWMPDTTPKPGAHPYSIRIAVEGKIRDI